ncbi:hypothetical protein KJ632_02960 [Patescibacteria group bacterium]|nr:hypothetical protein [Patescibacteria group bacterium]
MLEANEKNEIEMKTNFKSKPVIGAILIIAAVALYVFLLKPLAGEVSNLRADVSTKKTEVETLNAKFEALESAKSSNQITEVTASQIEDKVPVGMNQDDVIRELILIAEKNDVELNSISFGRAGSDVDDIEALRISASFEGSNTDLINFLKAIETARRFFKVNSISVAINTLDVTDFKRANFSLSLETFYQDN